MTPTKSSAGSDDASTSANSAAVGFARLLRWSGAHWADVVIVVGVSLLVFPEGPTAPRRGLDPSWLGALNVFSDEGVRFGSGLVFTYGPLGFLTVPVWYTPTRWLIAMAVMASTLLALTATAYVSLRRRFGQVATGLVLVVTIPFLVNGVDWYYFDWFGSPLPAMLAALAVLWAVPVAIANRPVEPAVIVALAAFTAFTIMVKLDSGAVVATALGLATVANAARVGGRRRAASTAVVFLTGTVLLLILLWLAIGQQPGDLVPWVRGAFHIIEGYASAMGLDDPGRRWEYAEAGAVIALGAAAILTARELDRGQKVALAVVLAPVTFIAFRQGFVRQPQHTISFFTTAGFVALALATRLRLAMAVAFGVLALVGAGLAGTFSLTHRYDGGQRLAAVGEVARTIVDPTVRQERTVEYRAALRSRYALPERFVRRVENHSVIVQPVELNAAFAYPELDWRILPVFQDYSAYTPYLDRLNAEMLSGDHAPDFVLREVEAAIDGRWFRWEPPEATVALGCHYGLVDREGPWALLERVPDQCGAPREIGTVEVPFGEPVEVPEAEGMVVARFDGIDQSLADRLTRSLFRSPTYMVDVGIGASRRLVPGTAGSWHLLDGPPCALETVDAGTGATTLTFSRQFTVLGSGGPVTITFGEVPITC